MNNLIDGLRLLTLVMLYCLYFSAHMLTTSSIEQDQYAFEPLYVQFQFHL
jgi:hypothetical protein